MRTRHLRPALAALAASVAIWSILSIAPAAAEHQTAPDAPFVPTPQLVVDRMLRLAEVTADDVVYDLGCGDGRIVIAAAKQYGARGVGIDIDPDLIAEARAGARQEGVDHLVTFLDQDLFESDVSDATVVMLYLLPALNLRLRPILMRQLGPGARVVSHNFDMEDWAPDTVDTFDDATGFTRNLFLWRIGGPPRP